MPRPSRLLPLVTSEPRPPSQRLLPLGALAAGFGLFNVAALAQVAPPATAPAAPAAPASAASNAAAASSAPAKDGTVLQAISVKAKAETDQNSVRATTSTIGRGNQELRDIPSRSPSSPRS